MRKDSPRGKPIFRSITSMFMAAVLASEVTHAPSEHHNPHGNRRERIEEMRQRALEIEQMSSGRVARASGNPPPPNPSVLSQMPIARRRVFDSDATMSNRPA
jgi:hypothetical protein